MQTIIRKWGNSLALRLPKFTTEALHLTEGSRVDIKIEDGSLRIAPTRRRFKLSELLEGHSR
ncbi:AbrB/MazE/SpoVT family DNA-binding domain-containing protein [Mesorhizobium sp.]|uniref:AbrB/MazE/SpoVT family DNA-binding domain-containing protein n=1 Tax=Mesorhizobium sp. TaxID=1871066 RepID=UPI0025D75EBB|nr:AbrB/MazE/SpoVT family DNA-binding domain-containing protein [Mesorhizobium sp.]